MLTTLKDLLDSLLPPTAGISTTAAEAHDTRAAVPNERMQASTADQVLLRLRTR